MNSDLTPFCQNIVRSKLLSETELDTLRRQSLGESGAAALPETFANWLVRKGKLTRFQADSLLRGHVRLILDEYTLLDRIGEGRMAGVYRAVDSKGLPVAVKILPPSKARHPESLARFQREAQLALQLDHLHVVRTYHAGMSEGVHYIAMEFLEGESLEERLARQGKLEPGEAVGIVRQALEGLEYLNDKGMVHRDIKPGNLMLVAGPGSTVKLLDVGLGRALFDETGVPNADLTTDGALIGTPDYMAPEQARNSHAADVRSDIYSLGCVLYQCLTGRVPFPDKNAVQKLTKHALEMPPPPNLDSYPRAGALKDVLWTMLAKDPAMRYPTPARAAKALEPFSAVTSPTPLAPSAPAAPPAPTPPALPSALPAPNPVFKVDPVQSHNPPATPGLRSLLLIFSVLLLVSLALLVVLLMTRE